MKIDWYMLFYFGGAGGESALHITPDIFALPFTLARKAALYETLFIWRKKTPREVIDELTIFLHQPELYADGSRVFLNVETVGFGPAMLPYLRTLVPPGCFVPDLEAG